MTDPALAYRLVAELAEDRRARGHHISPTQVERAAALLVDLWTAAAPHGIGPDHWGHTAHLPRAALDTVSAPPRRPPGSRPRPRRWQHRHPSSTRIVRWSATTCRHRPRPRCWP